MIFNLHVFGHKREEDLASVHSHRDSLQFYVFLFLFVR